MAGHLTEVGLVPQRPRNQANSRTATQLYDRAEPSDLPLSIFLRKSTLGSILADEFKAG